MTLSRLLEVLFIKALRGFTGTSASPGLVRGLGDERFHAAVGVAPMEYLLGWRMALAKELLRRSDLGAAEIAERIGYRSASTFNVAFTRHVGVPPMRYARAGG